MTKRIDFFGLSRRDSFALLNDYEKGGVRSTASGTLGVDDSKCVASNVDFTAYGDELPVLAALCKEGVSFDAYGGSVILRANNITDEQVARLVKHPSRDLENGLIGEILQEKSSHEGISKTWHDSVVFFAYHDVEPFTLVIPKQQPKLKFVTVSLDVDDHVGKWLNSIVWQAVKKLLGTKVFVIYASLTLKIELAKIPEYFHDDYRKLFSTAAGKDAFVVTSSDSVAESSLETTPMVYRALQSGIYVFGYNEVEMDDATQLAKFVLSMAGVLSVAIAPLRSEQIVLIIDDVLRPDLLDSTLQSRINSLACDKKQLTVPYLCFFVGALSAADNDALVKFCAKYEVQALNLHSLDGVGPASFVSLLNLEHLKLIRIVGVANRDELLKSAAHARKDYKCVYEPALRVLTNKVSLPLAQLRAHRAWLAMASDIQ
jgi:hypothetical protein